MSKPRVNSDYPNHEVLRLETDAPAQTVQSTETLTFKGLVDADKGISVTGGTFPSDANDSRYPLISGYPDGRLEISSRGTETSEQVKLILNTPDASGAGGGAQIIHNKSLGGATQNVLRLTGKWSGDYSGTGGNAYLTNAYLLVAGDIANTTTSFSKPITGVSSGTDLDTDNNWVSFLATTTPVANANKAASYIGYLSRVQNSSGEAAFGFYGDGDAPNFFKGNTYIGGTATRNTRELWESTLTEEQKEQLSAGTLAIPANVSIPGDGSFVRQWWYDQQSAEDQALIDSGELDYPKNFQAANFTDTFALGDLTQLDLMSNGVAKISGISFTKNTSRVGDVGYRGIQYSNGYSCPILVNRPNPKADPGDPDNDLKLLKIIPQLYDPDSKLNIDAGNITNLDIAPPANSVGGNADAVASNIVGVNFSNVNSNRLKDKGYTAAFQTNQGHYSEDGKEAFVIRSTGQAPSYHRGSIYLGGTADDYKNDNTITLNASNGAITTTGVINCQRVNASFLFSDKFLSNASGVAESFRANTLINHTGLVQRFNGGFIADVKLSDDSSTDQINGYQCRVTANPNITTDADIVGYTVYNFANVDTNNYPDGYNGNCTGFVVDNAVTSAAGDGNAFMLKSGFTVKGFESNIKNRPDANGDQCAYNFYAGDLAPSYFKGAVTGGGTNGANAVWSIDSTGTATGITLSGASVVTNEVDNTVETLLDIITDLRARITELESITLQPLYSTVTDLPSAADHHGKTAHVHSEGALYFAHAGNWVKLQNA